MFSFFKRPKTMFYTLGIFSGFFSAFYMSVDDWALSKYGFDPVIYGLYSEYIGVTTAFIFVLLLGSIKISTKIRVKRPLGALIDPQFQGLILPSKEYKDVFKYIFYAGVLGGINTLFYFLAVSKTNPAVIQPLFQFVTLYLLIFEILFIEKETPTNIEIISIINVVIGGIIITSNGSAGFEKDSLVGALLVLGPINLTQIGITYYQKKARTTKATNGRQIDALNIRLWFTFFMAISLTIVSIPFYNENTLQNIIQIWKIIVPIVSFGMTFTFIAYILYIRLLALGKMSVVNAITSISIVFSIIFTAINLKIVNGKSFTPEQWTQKILGSILVIAGIITLSLSTINTFVFIKCKPGTNHDVFEKLSHLKLESVALTSGTYDIIAKVNIRSVGRYHSLLIKKIEKIDGIEKVYTLTVMRQWERY